MRSSTPDWIQSRVEYEPGPLKIAFNGHPRLIAATQAAQLTPRALKSMYIVITEWKGMVAPKKSTQGEVGS